MCDIPCPEFSPSPAADKQNISLSAAAEWGVWPETQHLLADSTARTQSVRCGEASVNRTALAPDSKCVFKWAYATAAAATPCSETECTELCCTCTPTCSMSRFGTHSRMSIIGGSQSSSYGGAYGRHQVYHGQQFVHC